MKKTREIRIGNIIIGGENPVIIQSMTNTDTSDVKSTVRQIQRLKSAGCEIVRVSAYDKKSAKSISEIKQETDLPIVADIHFDYRLAIEAIEAGADKIRINPGNMSNGLESVACAARERGIPIRVGANSGSIKSEFARMPIAEALVESTLQNVRMLEKLGFYDIVVSTKASNVSEMVQAGRRMAEVSDYPQHLGVTEAGLYDEASIKSAVGIGSLLIDGIGATVRVSITGDPTEEIAVARRIISSCGLRQFGPEIISCPTCARTRVDVKGVAERVKVLLGGFDRPIKIAVMGCAVNGPGEARAADVGIAGGNGEWVLFSKGEVIGKYSEDVILSELIEKLGVDRRV